MSSNNIAWVYILTNETHTTLYVGSTVELSTRLWEHRIKQNPNSFSARYNLTKLVFYQGFHSVESARAQEKIFKGKSRAWKIALINRHNPRWNDLTNHAFLV